MKKGNTLVNWLVLAIGVIVIAMVTGGMLSTQQKTINRINESVILTTNTLANLKYPDVVEGNTFAIHNESGGVIGVGCYTVQYLAGKVNMTCANYTASASPVTYSYYPTGYVKSNLSRILITTVILLIILVAVVFIGKRLTEESG